MAALRRLLTDRLISGPDGYRLVIQPVELDIAVFEDLAERAGQALRGGDASAAAKLISQALELWRGAPLTGLPIGPVLESEVDRLAELRLPPFRPSCPPRSPSSPPVMISSGGWMGCWTGWPSQWWWTR
jgi:hypothetical protein